MAGKLPLAEFSLVANASLELPAAFANCGFRGKWHANNFNDILMALTGRLLPDGTVLEVPCSNWNRVFGESDLLPDAEPLVDPLTVTPCRGEHWLIAGAPGELNAWMLRCEQLLREKQLGWLTLYSYNGDVCQWNRAALRRWFKI